MAVRVGDGLIVTLPGEPTTEVGRARPRRGRGRPRGLERVVVSGLANEFIQYFTTPEEYDRQHYEGGSTLYGPLSSNLLRQELAELSRRLVAGEPAQAAYPLDPTNGVVAERRRRTARAPPGGRSREQPGPAQSARFGHARVRLAAAGRSGSTARSTAPSSLVQRRAGAAGARSTATSASGCSGRSTTRATTARWEVPRDGRAGRYRLRGAREAATGSISRTLPRARRRAQLTLRQVAASPGRVAVALDYPPAVRDVDLRHRPPSARGGVVRFRVGGRNGRARGSRGTRLRGRATRGRGGDACLRARRATASGTATAWPSRLPESRPVTMLVVGAGGMLGQDVVRAPRASAPSRCRHAELDVTDRAAVTRGARRGATA